MLRVERRQRNTEMLTLTTRHMVFPLNADWCETEEVVRGIHANNPARPSRHLPAIIILTVFLLFELCLVSGGSHGVRRHSASYHTAVAGRTLAFEA